MRRSCDCLTTFARTSLSLIYPQCCRKVSHLCRNWLRLNCEGSATSSRRVRDTRDDFATILRGILSHKIFEHVQNFRDYFEPLGDTCEEITNHWRLFRDCFATHSRCLVPAVAKQSQSSEIGASANSADPDDMLNDAVITVCQLEYPFRGFQYTD